MMTTPPKLVDPLASLPKTARQLVDAARRLLLESGYSSLSLERVTNECGLNKATVRYYFRTKSGLLEAVIESLMFDQMSDMLVELESSTGPTRLHRYIQAKRRISENADLFQAWVELLPAILRDARLARRATELYEWLIKVNMDFLGLSEENEDVSRCLAKLLVGVGDGLGIQNLINARTLQIEDTYAVFERLLESSDLKPFHESGPHRNRAAAK
jgi:AcrR family transcriptional regulator